MWLTWDYLIVTASNDAQARAYRSQLAARRELGLLPAVREAFVVPDPGGKRIGSGGSTACCLLEVLNREARAISGQMADWTVVEETLRRLRILIIHAGGDSRRLPAYGPCGKIFVPVPGESSGPLGMTLFDRLLPTFLGLPASPSGQLLVASGDALLLFDANAVRFDQGGLTALACLATPEKASTHGVFCGATDGRVRLYLQKPKPSEQARMGAIDASGKSLLDVGVMNFDTVASVALLRGVGVACGPNGQLAWTEPMHRQITEKGLDLYREICCALGSEATRDHHVTSARSSGSTWDELALGQIFERMRAVPFNVQVLPGCNFLHFGTTRQLITSGLELQRHDLGDREVPAPLSVNNELLTGGCVKGLHSWVEGCRISAPLVLSRDNVVVGLEVEVSLSLSPGTCLDVLRGQSRRGQAGWFVRCYGVKDSFKDAAAKDATFCGLPLLQWIEISGARPEAIWDANIEVGQRALWNARVFPWVTEATGYREWLWMHEPSSALDRQKQSFLTADRYSCAEIATLADQEDFYARRRAIRAGCGTRIGKEQARG